MMMTSSSSSDVSGERGTVREKHSACFWASLLLSLSGSKYNTTQLTVSKASERARKPLMPAHRPRPCSPFRLLKVLLCLPRELLGTLASANSHWSRGSWLRGLCSVGPSLIYTMSGVHVRNVRGAIDQTRARARQAWRDGTARWNCRRWFRVLVANAPQTTKRVSTLNSLFVSVSIKWIWREALMPRAKEREQNG